MPSYSATVVQDPESGDLLVPLEPELLAQLGWSVEDVLSCEVTERGIILRKEPGEEVSPTPEAQPAEKLYIVETVVSHRMRYAVRARLAEHAMDAVTMQEVSEFDQNPLGEQIFSAREVTYDEYLQAAELPRDPKAKMNYIHSIDYSQPDHAD